MVSISYNIGEVMGGRLSSCLLGRDSSRRTFWDGHFFQSIKIQVDMPSV